MPEEENEGNVDLFFPGFNFPCVYDNKYGLSGLYFKG